MFQETQSELFIRTLSDLLNDLRLHRHARQRSLHKAEADHYMTSFGIFRSGADPSTLPSPLRV